MSAKSTDSDNGSSIGGTIESGTVTLETLDLEALSFYLDLLDVAEIIFFKNNKSCSEYFSIAVK